MYSTMRNEMEVLKGKKLPDRKYNTEKEYKTMSEDEIIKKIEQNKTFSGHSINKIHQNNNNNKWIKTEYSHPGVYVN